MSAKEIRTKIGSVKNTQKITKAMEMVAASKMRKAQDRMTSARPYADKMRQVVSHIAHAKSEYRHPFLENRDEKRIGLIIVSSDRGLCGGLNGNLFRQALRNFQKWEDEGKELHLCLIGNKGTSFFSRIGGKISAQASQLGDAPKLQDLIGPVNVMLELYNENKLDKLYLVSNEFVNRMTQSPKFEQLLPLVPEEASDLSHHWDYIYEPEAPEVMDQLLTRYIESLVYQGVVENIACEQAARMVAMKSASDNAGKAIDELELIYNKARQAAITQELSEIVSGAAAV
ncbi:MAG: F0F1 ATP synthase subunit gamma [Gammaproteobacteria bacterium]|jgi:F-type H+-transporting ATPase subunit gamma|tara:strand:+ start:65 stop:922 length:858 start_codon:yes stop_codon:yes gene_type:complete